MGGSTLNLYTCTTEPGTLHNQILASFPDFIFAGGTRGVQPVLHTIGSK